MLLSIFMCELFIFYLDDYHVSFFSSFMLMLMLSLLDVYVTISYLYYLSCECLYYGVVFIFVCLLSTNSFSLSN